MTDEHLKNASQETEKSKEEITARNTAHQFKKTVRNQSKNQNDAQEKTPV